VTSVEPAAVPVLAAGATAVVRGSGFSPVWPLYCKFDGVDTTVGTYVSAVAVTCPVPTSSNSVTVTLEVSNNNADFSSSLRTLSYCTCARGVCCSHDSDHFVGQTTPSI
jgi:hypothetical protein